MPIVDRPGTPTTWPLPRASVVAAPDRDAVDEKGYPVYLDESDGMPMESDWHVNQFTLLIHLIKAHRKGREDFYCAGNMFVYYDKEQARNKNYRGPDFFLVNGASTSPVRPYWAVWKENFRYPDLIIELMSPSTKVEDLTTKFRIYEEIFSTREYVAYDPEDDVLYAWRKVNGKFEVIPPAANGRVYLEEAGLWLGRWRGERERLNLLWLRFFDANGDLVPTDAERADALAAELAQLKAQKK